MHPAFDGLTVLCRAQESRAGCGELCRDATGARKIRVRIRVPAIQKALLAQLSPQVPMGLAQGSLDLLLPWEEGQTLEEWLYAASPSLGQRRDLCLSLLASLIASRPVPDLVVMCARADNLRITPGQCRLQQMPDLSAWRPHLSEADMVLSAALLAEDILTRGQDPWARRRFPQELQMVLLRCRAGGYQSWPALQRDLAALPDDLLPAAFPIRRAVDCLKRMGARYGPGASRAAAVLLAVAALLSLICAYRAWRSQQDNLWPGMATVGGQSLHREEDGAT